MKAAKRTTKQARIAPVAQPEKPARGTRHNEARQNAFLAAYVVCASTRAAAKAARVSRSSHFAGMRQDPTYPARFAQAYLESNDSLEDSAVERAMIGVFEPNVFQGRFVYPEKEVVIPATDTQPEHTEMRPIPGARPIGVWKRSEMLHALLLRGRMRERYGNSPLLFTSTQLFPVDLRSFTPGFLRLRRWFLLRLLELGELPSYSPSAAALESSAQPKARNPEASSFRAACGSGPIKSLAFTTTSSSAWYFL